MSLALRHAVILAAGRGTRMMPLTDDIPKPMAPYLGSTLIANGIRTVGKHIPDIHVTVGYKGAMLAEHVISESVSSVINTTGHGNAWWIFNTLLSRLDEPLLVLTCDNVVELDFASIGAEYERLDSPACMLVPVEPVAGLEGDYIFLDGDSVTRIDRNSPSDRYCSGIQVINPARIVKVCRPDDDFYSVWSQLIVAGELRSSRIYASRWYTIDTVAQLDAANQRGSFSPG